MNPIGCRRWWAVAALTASLLAQGHGQSLTELEPPRLNLSGRVVTPEGQPIPNASVFIFTAGPRQGAGVLCPSCYPDCRKSGRTAGDGAFQIEALDSTLLFRLLVVGKDRTPVFVPRVDPGSGPVAVKLAKLARENLGPKKQLAGRVLDSAGAPVPNAVVNFDFFGGDEANCGGMCDGVDLIAVADEAGRDLPVHRCPSRGSEPERERGRIQALRKEPEPRPLERRQPGGPDLRPRPHRLGNPPGTWKVCARGFPLPPPASGRSTTSSSTAPRR